MSEDISQILPETLSADRWRSLGFLERAGVLAPLFSVYSKNSTGIGDFEDLKLLADWAEKTGNTILQLLPMNEVGGVFCPYDSFSSFAIEPLYICFDKIPFSLSSATKEKIKKLKNEFPAGVAYVDYRLKARKTQLLWEIFVDDGKIDHDGLDTFARDNAYWIYDYANFKVLKNHHAGKAWYDWEDGYKRRDSAWLADFSSEYDTQIKFEIWLQWLAFQQFKAAKEYANKKGVFIKGDLPVLVSRDSADVWAHPEFFKLDLASGAPPDMYCAKGQRWGMPPYNWNNIASSDFRYLKEKLRYADNFYDMLRIDHVVGLFRIWSIPFNEPEENQGLNGFFDPHDQALWGEHGRNILSVIVKNCRSLLCAEDLGVVPAECRPTLLDFGIPGNDIARWTKDWNRRHNFLAPEEYRPLSVAALSTHDTTIFINWWESEAGTIDEALFIQKCASRGIDYTDVKGKLFDANLSKYGRLRWLDSILSEDILVGILGKRKEEVGDFIDMYKNTFGEKAKLWRLFKLAGVVREKADPEIVIAALKFVLSSASIFAIQSILDYLSIDNILKGDLHKYRFNIPGTISDRNWSLTIPISLEDLLRHKVCGQIKKLVEESGR